MPTSRTGRTVLSVLLFPVCVLLLALISGVFTKAFLWMAPTGRAYVMSLFSDSSIGICLMLGIGVASWLVQRLYVRFTSRSSGTVIAVVYALLLLVSLVITVVDKHYYMAVVYTFLGIGQGVGLLIGRDSTEQSALA